jgi:hypothetical protein
MPIGIDVLGFVAGAFARHPWRLVAVPHQVVGFEMILGVSRRG